MFEAYKVSVTLSLNNLVSPHLAVMARDVAALQKEVGSLSAVFKSMERNAASMGAAMRSADGSAAMRSNAAAANESTAAFTRAAAAAATYRNEILAQRGAAMGSRTPPVFMPPALPPVVAYPRGALATTGGGQGGSIPPILTLPPRSGAAGSMPYTPFTMRTPGVGGAAVPPAGGGIPPGGGGGGGGAGGSYGVLPVGGMLPLAVAAGGIFGAKALYESARDYELAHTRFRGLNFGAVADKTADDFARKSRVAGVSSTQLMDTLSESVGLFGSLPNAIKLAPKIAQLNAANSALFSGKIGTIDSGVSRSIGRFNDMRGLTNTPEDFEKGLNLAQKLVVSSGGATKFSDLEQVAKRGGAAFKGMTDEGIIMLSSYLQEQGGNSAGTSLMSFYQNLVAGRTTKGAMAALEAAGLVKTKLVKSGAVGGKKSSTLVIDDIKDEQLLRENAPLWMMTYLPAAAKAAGKKTDSEIIKFVNDLVTNRRGSDMAGNYSTQQEQALRDATNTKRAWGTDQTISEYGKTAAGKQSEFLAAWSNFKTEFGTAALPAFTTLLTAGSDFLRRISTFMDSPAVKFFAGGMNSQQNLAGALVTGLRVGAPELQGTRTGAAVAGTDTAGGAFTGFRSPIRTSAAGAGRGMINNVIVMPNGRELARVVTQEQGKEMNRPQTGPRTVDGRQSLRAFDTERGG